MRMKVANNANVLFLFVTYKPTIQSAILHCHPSPIRPNRKIKSGAVSFNEKNTFCAGTLGIHPRHHFFNAEKFVCMVGILLHSIN